MGRAGTIISAVGNFSCSGYDFPVTWAPDDFLRLNDFSVQLQLIPTPSCLIAFDCTDIFLVLILIVLVCQTHLFQVVDT